MLEQQLQIKTPLTFAILLTIAILLMDMIYDERAFARQLNQTQYCHDHYSNRTVICHNPNANNTANLENVLVK